MAASTDTVEPKQVMADWRSSPQNEWAFVNVDQHIKTQTIKKADKPTAFFPSTSGDTSANITGALQASLKASSTDGFILLHKGKLVTEYYDHGNTQSTPHIMMSMTKSVTSLIIGILVDRGTLDTGAKVSFYVPEAKGTPYEDIPLRNLLDMRSGIQYDDNSHEYRYAFGWDQAHHGEAESDFPTFLSSWHPSAKAPGGPFEYLSVNTDMLGLVIERATSEKLSDLISKHLWKPIGAQHDALITVDRLGNPRAAGGMCATVRDLARLGQALIEGSIAPKAWIEDVLTGGNKEIFAASPWAPAFPALTKNAAYRSCWVADDEQRLMTALGIHGQLMVVDFCNDIVMVKTGSHHHSQMGLPTDVKMFVEARNSLGV